MLKHTLAGIYAAAITPIKEDNSIALDNIPEYLAFLSKRGCHGALILGTTGEGPSFSSDERISIFQASVKIREVKSEFRLLAGTGTPSLEETIYLTKSAFDLGFDGVVVLPPYYFHQATDDGIYLWFQELILRAVPKDRYLLGYHFPSQSGVPIPLNVITALKNSFPSQFAGFKDSTGDSEYAFQIGLNLDSHLASFVGNDRYLSKSLESNGSGCITAMANLQSPNLRKTWDAYQIKEPNTILQENINRKRIILDNFKPFPATIKVLISELHGFPSWSVRPPLTPMTSDKKEQLLNEIQQDTGWN